MSSARINEKGELIIFLLSRGLENSVLSIDALVLISCVEVSHLRSVIRYRLHASSLRLLRLIPLVDICVGLGIFLRLGWAR